MDRIASDHPSVRTIRATVTRHGGSRPRIEIPAADAVPDGVIRLVVDGTTYHARIEHGFADDTPRITGAYDTPGRARSPEGTSNRLDEWFRGSDRSFGSSVLIDVIEPDFAYGLRESGTETVYDAIEAPKDSLAAIARDVDG